ncbi:MAG: PIG-L family deacetylase [Acidobacteriaceae bacterium]|nr:PIG-L family deacetylase [Acidobacteriaceae bacterium]
MKRLLLGLLFSSRALLPADTATAPPPDARFKVDLLVVVAHPDDETEIGAYLARAIFDQKKRVAVVFGTRGNSGGNAEGQEQASALGAIREIEARQALAHFGVTDVWFLNGLDTPGQDVLDSLETWNHGESLGRLIRLIRLTRPSVIATWLPDWVAGENHGDHQAAGVIATESFDMAGDPTAFAEQLAAPRNRDDINNLTEGLRVWQPEKIYYFSDAANTDFMNGKGPEYSATDQSPSQRVSYAKLAAEECSYHLTQGDTGQTARNALEKNNIHIFEGPVKFLFGKSYVKSSVTGDLFQGVEPAGIPYRSAPGFTAQRANALRVELGGPWHFYRQFWQAHGLEDLSNLVAPEIMAKYASPLVIPVLIENPTSNRTNISFSVDLPDGWEVRRRLPSSASVGPHETFSLPLEVKTAAAASGGWKTLAINSTSGGSKLGQIRMRVELNAGAMPQ